MKQVSELYRNMVATGRVRAIRRFNLRKFCRSFQLPPCGISFWAVDDLNWDYLRALNQSLTHDQFRFRGGEHFPRVFFDQYLPGYQRRTEFIFLSTGVGHHRAWASFFESRFASSARQYGLGLEEPRGNFTLLRGLFRNALLLDLIHFSDRPDLLGRLGEFYLTLFFLTLLDGGTDPTRDAVFEAVKTGLPHFRSDVARIATTTEVEERLNDILFLLGKCSHETER